MKKLIERILFTIAALTISVWTLSAQTLTDPKTVPVDKSQQIVDKAIEVVGGQRYLNVTTVTGHGFFTPFQDGLSQVPAKFLDYIVFPDKERTEFTHDGIRTIQVNTGDSAWLYDGATKSL